MIILFIYSTIDYLEVKILDILKNNLVHPIKLLWYLIIKYILFSY